MFAFPPIMHAVVYVYEFVSPIILGKLPRILGYRPLPWLVGTAWFAVFFWRDQVMLIAVDGFMPKYDSKLVLFCLDFGECPA